MIRPFFQILLTLNECCMTALHAAKNYEYMVNLFRGDNSLTDYYDKTRQMAEELPDLYHRVEDLRKELEKFNRIAMQ